MLRKTRPRRGWNPPGLSGSDALTQGERAALSKIARELKPPESRSAGLADKLANVAITYRLMRQQDAKAGGEQPWKPQAPTTAEQRQALEHLLKDLSRAWEGILSLDAASREVLELAYRSALFDGTDPRRPRYPLAEPGHFEDDQRALDRMVDRAAVALHLLPSPGGRRPLHSLRWAVWELATIYTEIEGGSFSVGGARDNVEELNAPAYWVARLVKIIDPAVTDANLWTAFRQDFNTLQIPTP